MLPLQWNNISVQNSLHHHIRSSKTANWTRVSPDCSIIKLSRLLNILKYARYIRNIYNFNYFKQSKSMLNDIYIALFSTLKKNFFYIFFKHFLFVSFSLIFFFYFGSNSVQNPVLAAEHPLQFSLQFSFVKRWHTSVRFHPNKNLQRYAKNNPSIEPFYRAFTLPAVCIRETRSGTHIIQRYPYISNLLWEIECYISVLIRSERPAGCAAYNASCSCRFI